MDEILYGSVSLFEYLVDYSKVFWHQKICSFMIHEMLILQCYEKNLLFAYVKTKAQISCVVTAQLISGFDFATN